VNFIYSGLGGVMKITQTVLYGKTSIGQLTIVYQAAVYIANRPKQKRLIRGVFYIKLLRTR
jgi:hypothetical protein